MIDGINVLTMVPTGTELKMASEEGVSFSTVFGQFLDPGLFEVEQNSESSLLSVGNLLDSDEDKNIGSENDAVGQGRIELSLMTIPCKLDLPVGSNPVSGEVTGNFTPGSKSSSDRMVAEQRVSLPIGKEQMTAQGGADNADRLTAAFAGVMTKGGVFDSYAATTTAIESPNLLAGAVTQDKAAVAALAVFPELQEALTKTGSVTLAQGRETAQAALSKTGAITLAQGRETTQAADESTTALSGNPSRSRSVRDVISQYRLETQGDGLMTVPTSVNNASFVKNDDRVDRQLSQVIKDCQEQANIGDTAKEAQSPVAKAGWVDNGNMAYGKLMESRDYQGKQSKGQAYPAGDQPLEQSTQSQDNRVEPTAAFNFYQADVKVSEAALPKNQPIDNAANLYTQISDRVADRSEKGGQESFKMKLFPEGLGEVQVTLSLREDKVKLDIVTDTIATQRLLETQSAELKAALLNKNYDVSVVNISSRTEFQSADNNAFSFWGGDSGERSNWQQETRYAYEYQEEAAYQEQIQSPMWQPVSTGIFDSWA